MAIYIYIMILLYTISTKYTITKCTIVYCYDRDRELINLLCIVLDKFVDKLIRSIE